MTGELFPALTFGFGTLLAKVARGAAFCLAAGNLGESDCHFRPLCLDFFGSQKGGNVGDGPKKATANL